MARKLGRGFAPPLFFFFVGAQGPHLIQCSWAEVYLATKWRLDPSSRLVTIDTGQKFKGSCSQYNVAGVEVYLHAKWHLDPFIRLATIHQRYR